METSEGEELGKFYSQKERGGNIRCITEQNFKIKLQFECGTGIMSRYFAIECDNRNILILLILNTSIPQKVTFTKKLMTNRLITINEVKSVSGPVNRRTGKFGTQRGLGNYSQDGLEMEEFPKFQRRATKSG